MNKMLTVAALFVLVAALVGCTTTPAHFLPCSAPVPPNGYKVVGEEVTGTSKQIWLLGIGGSSSPQQSAAFADAMGSAPKGTDALVSMSIEQHYFSFLIYTSLTTSVTGTPVQFNK